MVGRLLVAAKAELRHGEFTAMVQSDLPFGARTAQRLMDIGKSERISNTTHASLLPSSWMTLYEISRLPDEDYRQALSEGLITPDTTRMDIKHWVKARRRYD